MCARDANWPSIDSLVAALSVYRPLMSWHVLARVWSSICRVSAQVLGPVGFLHDQASATHAFMCRLHDHHSTPQRPAASPEAARAVAARRASYAPHASLAQCGSHCCASAGTASNAKKQSAIHSKTWRLRLEKCETMREIRKNVTDKFLILEVELRQDATLARKTKKLEVHEERTD